MDNANLIFVTIFASCLSDLGSSVLTPFSELLHRVACYSYIICCLLYIYNALYKQFACRWGGGGGGHNPCNITVITL